MSDLFASFGVDLAQIVSDEMGPALLPATLTVATAGTRTTGSLAAGTNPTSTAYACRGFVEVATSRLQGSEVEVATRTVCLLGKSIAGGAVVPKAGDTIAIDGATGVIVGVPERDGARAVYVCRVSG